MREGFTDYSIDIVFCVDVTLSMGPYLEGLKKMVNNFPRMLADYMEPKNKTIGSLRVRVVSFRDLGEEGSSAIHWSPFFELPREQGDFERVVVSLEASGGGDEPESALEALWVAMNSSWSSSGERRRHIVVLATDATANPLGRFPFALHQSAYPTPRSVEELEERWGIAGASPDLSVMDQGAKRLVVLAPDAQPWSTIDLWDGTIFYPSAAGAGMKDVEMDDLVSLIADTV